MDPQPPSPQPNGPGEVTRWLAELRQGDRLALDALVSRLYAELRAIARQRLRGEWGTRPMATTELVHEAYLRLLQERRLAVGDRAQFFAVAANVMRRILVDAARARHRIKRGGGEAPVPLDEVEAFLGEEEARDMLLLDAALERLQALQPRVAEVVVHRYFSGLTLEESARLLGTSTKTVQRDWLAARAWLRKEIYCSSTEPMSQVATPVSVKSNGRV
jgi:RNA polymerase sigma factor (TIGR02999 family)